MRLAAATCASSIIRESIAVLAAMMLKGHAGDMGRADAESRLDDLDRAIVAQLQCDGRTSFRALAARLGVTELTVRRRTQHLMDAGYCKVVGVIDPLQFGQGHAVIVGISSDPPMVHAVA